jgi:thioredoxin reductase (NADPH)
MDPFDLRAAAFPRLDPGQIAVLARCTGAAQRHYAAGEELFRAGDRNFNFFVVASGEIEILDTTSDPPRSITVHGPGEFTGDVAQLIGGPSLVTAAARVDSEVYAVSTDGLRGALNRCPDLGDLVLQAFVARRQLLTETGTFTGMRVIGSRYSRDTFRIREFLAKNRVLFTWLDLEADPEVGRLLRHLGISEEEAPVVAWGQWLLRNPSNQRLAEVLGIRQPLDHAVEDLVVIGAGPAGLAAAVYGASEGLRTIVLERLAPGGQAGTSMRIENYLGFPTGISGGELVDRAVVQASKFGATLSVTARVVELAFDNAYALVRIEDGGTVAAKCLLIATGAHYRRLEIEGCERFEGCGVYYAATRNEAQMCRGSDVVVVGGGNSAGQAVVFLAAQTRRVFLVVRGGALEENMSSYLARRIQQIDNVEVLLRTTVRRLSGDRCLRAVEVADERTGQTRTLETPALFSFIGAVPRTDWLPPEIDRDAKSFIRTGNDVGRSPRWTARRAPFLLETSRAGVFAAGDVRSGSIKRVASAVGEGAMAVQFVHEYNKQM